MKRTLFIFLTRIALTLLFTVLPFSLAHAIKKCQDAEGRWHYGDVAVTQCNKTKVTTLNKRGFIQSEKSAPKTDEQLQMELDVEAKSEAERLRLKALDDERNRILSVYETEADIDRQRDNQIDSVESNIAVHRAYVKSVNAKIERLKVKGTSLKGAGKKRNAEQISSAENRVKESNNELEKLLNQKEAIIQRFSREKQVYLEIKNQPTKLQR